MTALTVIVYKKGDRYRWKALRGGRFAGSGAVNGFDTYDQAAQEAYDVTGVHPNKEGA